MKITQTVRRILELGCGLDLEKVLRSKRYEALCQKSETLLKCHPVGSDLGIALRAGHMEFGRLVNTVGERMAITAARDIKSQFGLGLEMRPLVQIVGEKIVQAATRCLTPEMKAMAKKWKTIGAAEQIEMCRKLYTDLRSTEQIRKGELTVESAWAGIGRSFEANQWDNKKVLPRQYGPWNPDTCVANCQGKTQMIVAFARLAGARVITVHPMIDAMRTLGHMRQQVYDLITDDIRQRNMIHIDETFTASLQGFLIENDHIQRHYFHVCAAVELSDGRWVLIDSHALNFGIFPDIWDIPSVADKLDRYKNVLPGLEIRATDHGLHKEATARAIRSAQNLIQRSRRLEESIREADSPLEIADTLLKTGEVWFILKQMDSEKREFRSGNAEYDSLFGRHASLVLAAGPDMLEAMRATMQPGGVDAFMAKRRDIILSSYHCIAIDEHRHKAEEGEVLHPQCDFANAEYSIAISAINSLSKFDSAETHRFFMEYSFDQVTLNNALSELASGWFRKTDESGIAIGMAAARCLRSLPMMHPLCLRKLKILAL